MIDLLKALAPFASIIVIAIQLIFAVILLIMQSKFTPRSEFEKLKTDHNGLAAKQAETELKMEFMEKALAQMPDADSIHKLSIQMTELKGELKTMNARFDHVNGIGTRLQVQIDRIDEFLKRGA